MEKEATLMRCVYPSLLYRTTCYPGLREVQAGSGIMFFTEKADAVARMPGSAHFPSGFPHPLPTAWRGRSGRGSRESSSRVSVGTVITRYIILTIKLKNGYIILSYGWRQRSSRSRTAASPRQASRGPRGKTSRPPSRALPTAAGASVARAGCPTRRHGTRPPPTAHHPPPTAQRPRRSPPEYLESGRQHWPHGVAACARPAQGGLRGPAPAVPGAWTALRMDSARSRAGLVLHGSAPARGLRRRKPTRGPGATARQANALARKAGQRRLWRRHPGEGGMPRHRPSVPGGSQRHHRAGARRPLRGAGCRPAAIFSLRGTGRS